MIWVGYNKSLKHLNRFICLKKCDVCLWCMFSFFSFLCSSDLDVINIHSLVIVCSLGNDEGSVCKLCCTESAGNL